MKTKSFAGHLLLLIICFLICGCDRNPKQEPSKDISSALTWNTVKTNLGITPKYQPTSNLQIANGYCYFREVLSDHTHDEHAKTEDSHDHEGNYRNNFYRFPLDLSNPPVKIVCIENALVTSYLIQQENDQDYLTVVANKNDSCVFSKYDMNGKLLGEVNLQDHEEPLYGIFGHLELPSDDLLLLESDQLFFYDNSGKCNEKIRCPGDEFQRIIIARDGSCYVTYLKWQGNSQDTYLSRIDLSGKKLLKGMLIPGSGNDVCSDANGILYSLSSEGIYRINPDAKSTELLVDLKSLYNIRSDRIQSFQTDGNDFLLIDRSNSMLGKPVSLLRISQSGKGSVLALSERDPELKYDEYGRVLITLYDPSGWMSATGGGAIVEEFNSDNDRYKVVIDTVETDLSTKLAGNDSPDLIFFVGNTEIKPCYEKGYLENLLPYFEQSGRISADDIHKSVFDAFGYDGGLYAIPQSLSFMTLMIPDSLTTQKGGWNIDEFLEWIEQNDVVNASSKERMKTQILSFCLFGYMNEWVDFENGKAYFDQDDFKQTLQKIETCPGNGIIGTREDWALTNSIYQSLEEYLDLQEQYNLRYVWRGYPSSDREPGAVALSLSNFCILSQSKCKEGAYSFLEYLLTYPEILSYGQVSPTGEIYHLETRAVFWSLKSLMAKDQEIYRNDPDLRQSKNASQEVVDLLMNILDHATVDTYEKGTIRSIVAEETQAYFAGQKSLDVTCDIIQNRVQLFLNENMSRN